MWCLGFGQGILDWGPVWCTLKSLHAQEWSLWVGMTGELIPWDLGEQGYECTEVTKLLIGWWLWKEEGAVKGGQVGEDGEVGEAQVSCMGDFCLLNVEDQITADEEGLAGRKIISRKKKPKMGQNNIPKMLISTSEWTWALDIWLSWVRKKWGARVPVVLEEFMGI